MSNPVFYMGVGNTAPALTATLVDGAGTVINLTGASVTFTMYRLGGASLFTRSCTVTDQTNGKVSLAWQASDTGSAGTFLGRFHATFNDSTVQDFPNDRYIEIVVS